MQKICLLGATGSIGKSTLELIEQHPERFSLFAVAANTNVDLMVEICERFSPKRVVMGDKDAYQKVAQRCHNLDIQVECGVDAMCSIASDSHVDQVMAAIVGIAGLQPTLAAVQAGKRVLLANKESLVTAGGLFMQKVQEHQATLFPVDSEHNAIFQCLPQNEAGVTTKSVERVLLTASGGPFRDLPIHEMQAITPKQACQHPNWSMGRKISVDSASLMNKGLELIEACWLFGLTPDDIEVVIHPQSIVHSMVSYKDGSVLAQMGNPDMKIPIAYSMTWPERITTEVDSLNLLEITKLDFQAPDYKRFPNLRLAGDAWSLGGTAMATLNAANEVAVDAFLNEKIGFLDIATVNEKTLERSKVSPVTDLDAVLEADMLARSIANDLIHLKANQ